MPRHSKDVCNVPLDSPLCPISSSPVTLFLQAWNELRLGVLSDMLTDILVPSLTRELRQTMLAASRDHAVVMLGKRLWKFATQAPLKVFKFLDPSYQHPSLYPAQGVAQHCMKTCGRC